MSSRPSGDPAGMRSEARALLDEAARIRASARSLPDVPEWVFLGPAASRLRAYLTDRRSETLRAAGMVESAASQLFNEASSLDQAIARWEADQRAAALRASRHV
ncbi:MAG: hypothetical protein ACYDAN_06715 [Candidatus Limnocylindrales bacterium]